MKIIKPYQFLCVLIIGVTIIACEQVPDCNQEATYDLLKIKLFDKDSLIEEKVKYDSIKAIGSDSLFFTASDSLSIYALELNSSTNTTTFLMYSGLKIDSLSVVYDKVANLPFEECSPIVDISNIVITKSTFDSTVLIADFLNINLIENIEIYQ